MKGLPRSAFVCRLSSLNDKDPLVLSSTLPNKSAFIFQIFECDFLLWSILMLLSLMCKDSIVGHQKNSPAGFFPLKNQQPACNRRQISQKHSCSVQSLASYSVLTISSPSLLVRTWGCRGRSHQGKPSASRCLWWCRGWRSAWNERRTYQGPKSSSPVGCQTSYSGCWCSGRTGARPSSSDGGTESWWSPGGGKETTSDQHQYINSVEDQLMLLKCLQTVNCDWCFGMIILFNCLNTINSEFSHSSLATQKSPLYRSDQRSGRSDQTG